MKKRGFLSHVTNLILAAIVILIIVFLIGKFIQGLGGREIHPGSEMSLERVKEQIELLLESDEPFAETTTRFSIHPDYIFIAGDKQLKKEVPMLQATITNIPNKYASYAHTERKCHERSCICLFDQEGKPICKSFLPNIIFIGEEGKDPYHEPYLGSKRLDELTGKVALSRFNLTTIYIAKITTNDDRFGEKTKIYITPIMREGTWGLTIEQIRTKVVSLKEEIAEAEYEKNYDIVSCSGAQGFYRSTDDECSKLYLSENHKNQYYPEPTAQIISIGKIKDFYEQDGRLTKPYCCQVIEEDTECESSHMGGYAKCSDTESCQNIKYTNPHNNQQYPSISIGKRDCAGTCCYANGAKPRLIEFTSAVYCEDETKNYEETDIDCGGPECEKCTLNKRCEKETDCQPKLTCEEKRVYDTNGRSRRMLINQEYVTECKSQQNQQCNEIADCQYGLKCKDNKCVPKEEGDVCEEQDHCGGELVCEMRRCVDPEKEAQEETYKMYEITIQTEFGPLSVTPIYIKMGAAIPTNYKLQTLGYFEMPKKYKEIVDGELIYSNGEICQKNGVCLNHQEDCGYNVETECPTGEYCCSFFDKCVPFQKPTSETVMYEYDTNIEEGYFVRLGEGCLPYEHRPKFNARSPYFTTTTYGELLETAFILYQGDDAPKAHVEEDLQQNE